MQSLIFLDQWVQSRTLMIVASDVTGFCCAVSKYGGEHDPASPFCLIKVVLQDNRGDR